MLRVPSPCVFCKGGYDAADVILVFAKIPRRIRSRPPPFAKNAKDRAPTVLAMSKESKAWATRLTANTQVKLGFGFRNS